MAQILAQNEKDLAVVNDVKRFYAEKDRVMRGKKEAAWNYKYLKVIENPVRTIEKTEDLQTVQMHIGVLLRSLHNIYNSSNFYKETRMVSFIDRLLVCVTSKLRKHCSLGKALRMACDGPTSTKSYVNNYLKTAHEILNKFEDGFFMKDLLTEKSSENKVSDALGNPGEERKSDFDQSFYRQQGLDFLSFQRPGTAYGSFNMTASSGFGASRSGFFDPSGAKIVKPA